MGRANFAQDLPRFQGAKVQRFRKDRMVLFSPANKPYFLDAVCFFGAGGIISNNYLFTTKLICIMTYELSPIQLPTLETCKRLQQLGVLPPKGKSYVYYFYKDSWGALEVHWLEPIKEGYAMKVPEYRFEAIGGKTCYFAPTLDQLLQFAKTIEEIEFGYWADFITDCILQDAQNITELFALELIRVLSII